MEEGDWDLQAVVRGCNRGGDGGRRSLDTGTSAATIEGNYICSTTPHVSSSLVQEDYHGSISCEFRKEEEEQFGHDVFFHFPNLSTPSPSIESWAQELEQFYKPFFPSNPTFKTSFSLSSSMPPLTKPHIQKHQKQILSSSPLFHLQNNGGFAPSPSPSGKQQQRPASRLIATNTTTRPKRRKNQQKSVVCHVPADGLSSDMWAWRKYGQKPIKGSPYPRGYYRCSSSKGCLARKQVERSIKDPGVFVITYTAEHNHSVPTHRNSLAGSVRNKASQQSKPTASPMHSTTDTKVRRSRWFNPVEEEEEVETVVPKVKKEGEMMDNKDDDNGMLLMSDMQMLCEDDLMLLDEDEQLNSGKHFLAFPSWPWISNQTHQSN